MIKRIELVNFLSHEHSVIELTGGLNVLVGPNNCGKSAVVTALQVLCYNDDSKYVLRHGAKECRIEVETEDGHIIRWSRKKSGSPKYEIDGETFDRLGRNGTPDRLHEVLKLPRVESEKDVFDVHFGEQRNPVFLLNDKPRAAAEFFASSSDASRLVEMQALHKQRVRDRNMDLRRLSEEASDLDSALSQLAPIDAASKRLKKVERHWEKIRDAEEEAEHFHILIAGIEKAATDLEHVTSESAAMANLTDLPSLVDPKPLQNVIEEHQQLDQAHGMASKQLESLDPLTGAPKLEDFAPLAGLLDSMTEAQAMKERLAQLMSVCQPLTAPPQSEDCQPLAELIAQQTVAAQSLKSLKRQTKQMQKLDECPEPKDIQPISKLVEAIQTESTLLTNISEEWKKLAKETQHVEKWIGEWAERNPECPTCGGPVTTEQLISQGGHQHGS